MQIKFLFTAIAFVLTVNGFCQTKTLILNKQKIIIEYKTETNEIDETVKDTIAYIYLKENTKSNLITKFTICSFSADCNNTFLEKGIIEIINNQLILSTHIKQSKERPDPVPEFYKMKYEIKSGKAVLIYNKYKKHNSDEWVDEKD